jgi:DNA-binding IclR family transcriptional regulator
MTIADERILEYLSEHDSGTPKRISDHEHVDYGRSYIHQRCQKLERCGLVQFLGNGVYILTEKGQQYLNGEFDARELDPYMD